MKIKNSIYLYTTILIFTILFLYTITHFLGIFQKQYFASGVFCFKTPVKNNACENSKKAYKLRDREQIKEYRTSFISS